ncbi:MAG: hypothetical protein ACRDJ9_14310, partial [Dehalococcoidia bacterium]
CTTCLTVMYGTMRVMDATQENVSGASEEPATGEDRDTADHDAHDPTRSARFVDRAASMAAAEQPGRHRRFPRR